MFHLIQEEKYNFVVVMAFRESGKSTIMNMANVLWSILGKPGKKFVIIVSNTQEQAKNHFLNIKSELEGNEALREDFGPFTENEAAWNRLSLELDYCGAKILSIARDQRVRGLKHNQYRPDLIICDDLEDSVSVEDRTLAAALGQWFESEILAWKCGHKGHCSWESPVALLGRSHDESGFIYFAAPSRDSHWKDSRYISGLSVD